MRIKDQRDSLPLLPLLLLLVLVVVDMHVVASRSRVRSEGSDQQEPQLLHQLHLTPNMADTGDVFLTPTDHEYEPESEGLEVDLGQVALQTHVTDSGGGVKPAGTRGRHEGRERGK
ncbi:hypothetical protein Pcinc_043540 [Petrolisthes cinctipes]|uniref:Secreted protein n=1 Tax=Petrolisthes cinctipes TaxID=88211 RepID=A0AAE1EG06_PETCI|nr:hypothetical protein Pcinc_043540 [Petrolisthes cinctipes]